MVLKNVKYAIQKIPFFMVLAYIAADRIRGFQLQLGHLETNSGTPHQKFSVSQSVDYIGNVFNAYKKYGKVEQFYGLAAEVGPGDNAGVALLMRQDGCEQVDLIDRFYSRRSFEQQARIYAALAQQYGLDEFRAADSWNEQELLGINWKIGQPAEVYFEKCAQERGPVYDFIVSCAVLEHLYNPLKALQEMVSCLKPGGRLLHQIDFRDHGMFSRAHHELTFLSIPTAIYPLMVYHSGRPNRILIHRYRELLNSLKINTLIDYSFLITSLVRVGQLDYPQRFEEIDPDLLMQSVNFVKAHRHEFCREFNSVDSQDLAVSGVFLAVTKK